jgi:branched-chain amino acid transport system permease protein
MRACSENLNAAQLMGINVNHIITIAFVIGTGLAGIAGFIYASQYSQVTPTMGFTTGLKAFVACIIGGVGNIYGALFGGILLGLAEMLTIGMLPAQYSGYRDTFVFTLLIIILFVRPTGIFGAVEDRRG